MASSKAVIGLVAPEEKAEPIVAELVRVGSVNSDVSQLFPRKRGGRDSVHDENISVTAESCLMRDLVDLARRVAKVDSTVLVTGESGVGKERIARLVHKESSRAHGPFVAINCGAVTETLLESELFGHARGAFTNATRDRVGLFDEANGGTILLDEIGEISAAMQVKLLRVLQEREIRRVGENKSRPIDVRVIASTNRDLAACVAAGTFRQDLYYRIKVVELHVPPLRERPEDILPLAQMLLSEAAFRMKRNLLQLAPAAADRLLRHEWPGNVRELANVMERAVALARGVRVEARDLPAEVTRVMPQPAPVKGAVRPLNLIEQEYILAALASNNGNQATTAAQLEIGSATLYRKLKRYREGAHKRPQNCVMNSQARGAFQLIDSPGSVGSQP